MRKSLRLLRIEIPKVSVKRDGILAITALTTGSLLLYTRYIEYIDIFSRASLRHVVGCAVITEAQNVVTVRTVKLNEDTMLEGLVMFVSGQVSESHAPHRKTLGPTLKEFWIWGMYAP